VDIDLGEARLAARLRVKDMADRAELLDRLALLEILAEREDLAYRVAELEAARGEPTGTQWGTAPDANGDPNDVALVTPTIARRLREKCGWTTFKRTAPGPWREAS